MAQRLQPFLFRLEHWGGISGVPLQEERSTVRSDNTAVVDAATANGMVAVQ